jgi:hypothetical protein
MKKTILLAVSLMAMAQSSFALESTQQVLGFTAAEVIASTAMVVAISESSSITTSQKKALANKILLDVQAYNQNGTISVFLAAKIKNIRTLNQELSISDSVDVLVEAANLILQ